MLSAVRQDGYAFEFSSSRLRHDHQVILEAVTQCGLVLEKAPFVFQEDYDVVLAAVKQNGRALKYGSDDFITNIHLRSIAKWD